MAIKIINDKCKGCSLCAKACPFDALKIVDTSGYLLNRDRAKFRTWHWNYWAKVRN